MKQLFLLALMSVAVSSVSADDPPPRIEVSVNIPRLNVSEYHRPYVAVWIQDKNRKVVANLAVWYQIRGNNKDEGTKWLPDLRQWWRRSGRSLDHPVDGVSGATRPAGEHTLQFTGDEKRFANMRRGDYELVVEAAREVGGREMVQIPFSWPPTKTSTQTQSGETELGDVSLTIR
ncbi:hypothetical protein Mal15_54090 [Stieleria maiorica]|uniref:DUF2271 domain-containing protein n=1 Tax=Stieleria maiorica TaxID=2795974 RepID=A0A5B9MIZ0_9BACT|nr:hypothetical protein Mal15_54090 [Stieleria maiorica]